MHAGQRKAFTLIELLVTVSIIGLLIGILLPALAAARKSTTKVSCASNLRQVGVAVQAHRIDHKDRLPVARYMPPPFISVDTDPPLPEAMASYLPVENDGPNAVWRCPDDDVVFELCGTSYDYVSMFSGQRPKDIIFIRLGYAVESQIILSRDFDDASADLDNAAEPLEVPARHLQRNNLWLDGRVDVIDEDLMIKIEDEL